MSAERSISGSQCVDALVRVGFTARHRAAGLTILERGYRVLVVPDTGTMSLDQLAALLNIAGVTYAQFLRLLDAASEARIAACAGDGEPDGA